MAEPKPNFNNESQRPYDEQNIEKCLQDKRIGFEEISVNCAGQVFRRAPQNETFKVPSFDLKAIYENHARQIGRKDLKFIIGDKE